MITTINTNNATRYSNLYKEATAYLRTHDANGNEVTKDSEDACWKEDEDISSLAEYFAYIKQLTQAVLSENTTVPFTKLPIDEDYFEIDANSRTINVPDSFKKNGISVKGDEIAEIVYFKINRYFDIDDLSTKEIAIQYKNAENTEGIIAPYFKSTTIEPNYLVFGWPITSKMTAKEGNLQFSVRFYTLGVNDQNETVITYSLSTLTQTVSIKSGLDYELTNFTVENVNNTIGNRIINSIINSAEETIAVMPTFILDLNNTEGAYAINETNKTVKADLINDGESLKLPLKVEAFSSDAGTISYEWNNESLKSNASYIYEETNDESPVTGKSYYLKNSEGIYEYKSFSGENAQTDFDNLKENLLERKYETNATEIGQYYCIATNRVRKAYNEAKSYVLTIPAPEIPEFIGTYNEHFIRSEKNNSLVVNAESTDESTNNVITYEWRYLPLDKDSSTIFDSGTVISTKSGAFEFNDTYNDGYYAVTAINSLNGVTEKARLLKEEEDIKTDFIFRVTEPASKLTTVMKVGDDIQYNAEYNAVKDTGIKVVCTDTNTDKLTYHWYKLTLTEDIDTLEEKLKEGTYEITGDSDMSETSNTFKPLKNETAYYFCMIENTYNEDTCRFSSPAFKVIQSAE